MKQTFVSDVLEIPEKIESAPKTTNVAATAVATAASAASLTPPADSTTEDDDEENEDDWENMFDENGDCLNPKILQELTESVGKCKIELPKMDYSVSKCSCVNVAINILFIFYYFSFITLSNRCSMRRSFRMCWRSRISLWNSRHRIC